MNVLDVEVVVRPVKVFAKTDGYGTSEGVGARAEKILISPRRNCHGTVHSRQW